MKILKIAKRNNASNNRILAFRVPAWHTWGFVYYDKIQKVLFVTTEEETFVNDEGEIDFYDDADVQYISFDSDERFYYPVGFFYKAARLAEQAGLITGQLECGSTEMNRYRSC